MDLQAPWVNSLSEGLLVKDIETVSQDDTLRPPVMRVGLECDQAVLVQVVDDPLHVLAIGTQVASEPCDRLRAFGGDDGAENLPAGARQPEPGDQPVTRSQ